MDLAEKRRFSIVAALIILLAVAGWFAYAKLHESPRTVKVGCDPVIGQQVTRLYPFVEEVLDKSFSRAKMRAVPSTQTMELLLADLSGKKIDCIVSDLPAFVPYTESYDFSASLFDCGPLLVISRLHSVGIINFEDLESRSLGCVQNAGYTLQELKLPPGAEICWYPSVEEALDATGKGIVDACLCDAISAVSLADSFNFWNLRSLPLSKPLTGKALRLIVLKGKNAAMLEAFNAEISAMRQDGTYAELASKWGVQFESIRKRVD